MDNNATSHQVSLAVIATSTTIAAALSFYYLYCHNKRHCQPSSSTPLEPAPIHPYNDTRVSSPQEACKNKGTWLLKTREYDAAICLFTKVLVETERDSSFKSWLYQHRAIAYFYTGNTKSYKADMNLAIKHSKFSKNSLRKLRISLSMEILTSKKTSTVDDWNEVLIDIVLLLHESLSEKEVQKYDVMKEKALRITTLQDVQDAIENKKFTPLHVFPATNATGIIRDNKISVDTIDFIITTHPHEQLLKINPTDPEIVFTAKISAMQEHDDNPDLGIAYVNRGFLRISNQRSAALSDFKNALPYLEDINIKCACHYALGILYNALRDFKNAQQHLLAALAISDDSSVLIHVALATVAWKVGCKDKALTYLNNAMVINSTSPTVLYYQAIFYLEFKKNSVAISCLKQILDNEKNDTQFMINVKLTLGIVTNEMSYIDQALVQNNYKASHYLLAASSVSNNALSHLSQAIDLDPLNPSLYLALAKYYSKKKKQSIKNLKKAISLARKSPCHSYTLVSSVIMLGEQQQGENENDLQKALASPFTHTPSDIASLLYLIKIADLLHSSA